MAKEVIIERGEGHITDVPRMVLDVNGNPSAGSISQLFGVVTKIVKRINGGLSFGAGENGARAGNHDVQTLEFTTPSTPNEEFAVDHALGRVPAGYWPVRNDKAGELYDSNVGSWTERTIYLKCSVGSKLFRILVY